MISSEENGRTKSGSTNHDVAIVVPFCTWDDWVMDCVAHCQKLTFQDFVIWLLPNDPPIAECSRRLEQFGLGDRLRIEPTGPGNPAKKRNVAICKSDATVFALVDADAYPRPDWLNRGLELLQNEVGAVAGPNMTPEEDPVIRRVAGHVLKSQIGFGAGYIRHRPTPRQFVREMPTCNMIFRRENGLMFREELDTSEDMMFCAELRSRGKKILYDPEIVVFHHRRKIYAPFMRQMYFYGVDKGRLARSAHNITYLWQAFPALLFIYLAIGCVWPLLPLPPVWRWGYYFPFAIYSLALLLESIRWAKGIVETGLTFLAFMAAHLSYGFGYLRGLVSKKQGLS